MPRNQCLSFVPLNERRHVELELVIGLRDSKGAINTRLTRLWLDELGPKAALGLAVPLLLERRELPRSSRPHLVCCYPPSAATIGRPVASVDE